jgi:D-alanyl-D-alanine carboxypeptidase/D-alanyl-D-alanine-endopeptidase (penicillin-binding protein 4)
MSRSCVAALAVLLSLAFASTASAASLQTRLSRALVTPGVSSSWTGAFVYDLRQSKIVFGHNRNLSLRPASNEKLTVAVTALERIGPTSLISTEVLGEGSLTANGSWHGRLVLKGYGNPSLQTTGLRRLAEMVRDYGISKVTGRIVADESYFDNVRVGPGWKASFYKEESPPLSALIANRARFDGRIASDPARAAAVLFKRQLRAVGVTVLGRVVKGVADPGSVQLGVIRSRPISWIVRRMNRISDNFYAEMLVKLIGARIRGSGTTADGTAVVRTTLRNHGVPMQGVRIADGSGLSRFDRLTPRAVVYLLIWAASDSDFDNEFIGSLPVAGVNGTLEDRMKRAPAHRHVLAKTGTTDRASALSGYVTNTGFAPRYVFSVIQNGNPIPWWYARQAQDRFAQVLAGAAQ